jgi:hypothetical protein
MAPLLGATLARAEPGLRSGWLGTWRGSIGFRRSLPMTDILLEAAPPQVETEDRAPIAFETTLEMVGLMPQVRTRIEGGPMRIVGQPETLLFAPPSDGVSQLAGPPRSSPHAALLTVRPGVVGTEALFRHADGSFWRRHVTLRFGDDVAEVLVWVFDAEGTRARTWRGEARKLA